MLNSYTTLQAAITDLFPGLYVAFGTRQEKVLHNALKDLFKGHTVITNSKKASGLVYPFYFFGV